MALKGHLNLFVNVVGLREDLRPNNDCVLIGGPGGTHNVFTSFGVHCVIALGIRAFDCIPSLRICSYRSVQE